MPIIWMPLILTEVSFSHGIPSAPIFYITAVPVQTEDHDFRGQIPCVVCEAPHTIQRNRIAAVYQHRRNG
ncbi:hypothetical protein [Sphingobacterium multivorum]|uniref:hypothetical protein n=1 Tax=Sphingobacterium multivorum TaxID=28454 RepID=UPI0028998CD0|nr:hypothetical protein [Sphingobacterium multivorum]